MHITGGTGRFENSRTEPAAPIQLTGTFRFQDEHIEARVDGWFLYGAAPGLP